MSDVVITLIQEFFKNFSQYGIDKHPSEKMALLVQQINTVKEGLEEVQTLPRDTPLLILTGFTMYSMPEFVGPFELMLNTERVIKLNNDGDRNDGRK